VQLSFKYFAAAILRLEGAILQEARLLHNLGSSEVSI
jgi:hypothetical protein